MKTIFTFLFSNLLVIAVLAQGTPGEIGALTTIESYAAFQGYDEAAAHLGQGEYQIYYDNIDGVLDKPIIICDGFDPEDSRDISTIYGIGNFGDPTQNIFDNLRDEGADVVVLNFPNYTRADDGVDIQGGADFIERNGLVLVNLIESIKNDMTGTEELIVVGPSMGGLVTRYALTYMEQNSLDHQTGIWLSFDSPHKGANVPISFQYTVNYMAEEGDDDDLRAMRDVELNSAAAKQMLLDHYIPHLADGEAYEQDYAVQLPTPHSFRATFLSNLSDLGDFPQQTRNLAIVNGSLSGTMVESPGTTVVDTSLDLGSHFGLDIQLYFTPAAGVENYVVDHLQPTYYGVDVGNEHYGYATSPVATSGLDSAPGGTVLFDSYFGSSTDDILIQFQEALQVDAFSFIPTMSSMAIDETDWYHVVNGTEATPFDAYVGGNTNQPHLTLTDEYAAFLMDEFSALYLGTSGYLQVDAFQLLSNPVQENIVVRINSELIDSKLSFELLTVSGQLIASYDFDNNRDVMVLPSPSASGLYLLRISNGTSFITKKVIVE
jgi:pimeloyl-ACP methyl ester carboxylesterase